MSVGERVLSDQGSLYCACFPDSGGGMCEEQPIGLHEGMFLPTIEVSLPLFTITHTTLQTVS